MSDSRSKPVIKDVPLVVKGKIEGRLTEFQRGKFLGKGGFARCYELIRSDEIYAGKCISKTLLMKKSQREKVVQEIKIHSTLKHPNVVNILGHFEDDENVYVLLELCARRSLMELSKRRRTVTEPEARYFTDQLVAGCEYLHSQKIIHRDLKLGNLFLNDDIVLKIGDFGLATKVEFDGQKKQTLCGTPNYIAPEMLMKAGHSYGVDIWAIGCILYTLLCGKPPFETESLKQTYSKIKTNDYIIPKRIGQDACNLINALLAAHPENRPSVFDIRKHPFFTDGFMPKALPTSCLVSAPRFNVDAVSGGPIPHGTRMHLGDPVNQMNALKLRNEPSPRVKQDASVVIATTRAPADQDEISINDHLEKLCRILSPFLNEGIRRDTPMDVQEQDPASAPIYWIAKWVDYSNKYGLSYQLSDESVGVIFNDQTKAIVDRTGENIQYTERDNTEMYYTMSQYPPVLEKKLTLLRYFRGYMSKHLLTAGQSMKRQGDELSRLPQMTVWFRTTSAIIFLMTDGTLQVNFFEDHTKIIISSVMTAATYINVKRECQTYQLKHLEEGCPHDIQRRLAYAKAMADRLLKRRLPTPGVAGPSSGEPAHVIEINYVGGLNMNNGVEEVVLLMLGWGQEVNGLTGLLDNPPRLSGCDMSN
ncbi:unnamed protein product [Bursaphelenchus xylophilus]|uniref:Serine/threonine-protein kinase PLK n=1 Tax=Bursaphelenchus xylophilus TaxID=6326 RepID=A0A7I8WHK7_BURXY|nr:unnamed protein product [Bursaphelenchus xylophilus]CAG9109606.1 unnamed protein product [Bursaphelenchus xylophilus]